MSIAWAGSVLPQATCNLGPLAVVAPLLEQMDVAAIIDRHLPPDPQLEFSHGQVLRLLLGARLSQPLALVNVAGWAEESGAEYLWGIPADKLNDDRLGRALDAFFTQRHSILGSVAAHVVHTFRLPLNRLHYDTTPLVLCGAYENSRPIPDLLSLPPATSSAHFPPAHITHGYAARDAKMIQAGLCSVVDDLGAVPIFGHMLSGNRNGKVGIAEHFQLLEEFLQPHLPSHMRREPILMISDRGTYSAAHIASLYRAGHHVLCSVPWGDFRTLFREHRDRLLWNNASYLSIEQKRRRDRNSSLPKEHYELAVLRHELTDPKTGEIIPCRVIFVFSSADQKACKLERDRAVTKIRAGLERFARSIASGHYSWHDPVKIHRRIVKLLGRGSAGRLFRWELAPLSAAEQTALPPPQRGCRPPQFRLVFHLDEAAAQTEADDFGYSVLVTAPLTRSADTLFAEYKQQCYVELGHHQFKTPLAVQPLFLKSPERIEALVYVLMIALTAYHLLQRLYRQAAAADAPITERRMTTESILRSFRHCLLVEEQTALGNVVHPVQLTQRQRRILELLHYPTPAQTLARRLPRYPRE